MRERFAGVVGTLRTKLSKGMTQVELRNLLDVNGRDASRIAKRLVARGVARRVSVMKGGRWTYRIRLTREISDEELLGYIPGALHSSSPKLDFIAPDLTPRVAEAVRLRLSGLKVREVAERMGITAGAVDT